MAQNGNSGAVPTLTMDSRKFLSALNDGAQAKVAFFEERVQAMGEQADKNWRLAALHAKELYIEDVDNHTYFIAEHSRDHGKVSITNIRPVEIVEGEKQELFSESSLRLINALEANDQKEMGAAFGRLKAQRFSSRIIPESGKVKCRDGVLRTISVTPTGHLAEDIKDRLVACIVESLRDRVIVENGHVVGGTFGEEEIILPVTKWAARKLVARRMLESAQNAYWSEGFRGRIYSLAKQISEGKIEEAVKGVSGFLDEMEEFTLLSRGQTQTLIENALASKAVFNQQLCDDTATLFYRTNLKINRGKIVEEWKNIARKAEHPVLAENVSILENSKNFGATYDKFLHLIFEAISNREVAAEALATTLDVLRNKTPKIKESHELSSKLNGLISRLKQRNFDDAAIYEAEDLIATIQEELGAAETLGNFDQMPGDMEGMDATQPGMDAGAGGAPSGAPVININSPLIQIGGSSAAGPGDAVPPGGDPAAGGGDPELEALLGGGAGAAPPGGMPPAPGGMPPAPGGMPPAPGGMPGQPPAPGGMPGQPLMQGRDRHGRVLGEGVPPWQAGRGNPKERPYRDDHPSEFEEGPLNQDDDGVPDDADAASDPYAVKKGEKVATEGLRFTDYGAPVITDEGDLDKIIRIMQRLATEHRLTGKDLSKNLQEMAKASIKAIGLRIPDGKLPKALEQCVNAFSEEWEKPWLKDKKDKKKGKKDCDEGDEDCDDEGVAENQFKYPWRKPRGFARSNYGQENYGEGQGGKSQNESRRTRRAIAEGITWTESQKDAILGELAGVRFIFDHGGDSNLEPVILSEDGAVEIPIPQDLFEDAYTAARLSSGGDGTRFVGWLANSLEQLRPITMAEDRALEEAVAKITAGPDGTLSVEVSPDVDVQEMADQGGGASGMDAGGMDAGGGMDNGEAEGMAPVDATEPAPEPAPTTGGGEDGLDPNADESMPDFEAQGGGMGQGEPAQAPAGNAAPTTKPAKPMQQGVAPAQGGDDDGIHFEDKDFTAPSSSKYTAPLKDNKRKMPETKMPGKTTDKLDGIGPELKVDDGSGVNPPTARKGSEE